jgi:hypothetical protein
MPFLGICDGGGGIVRSLDHKNPKCVEGMSCNSSGGTQQLSGNSDIFVLGWRKLESAKSRVPFSRDFERTRSRARARIESFLMEFKFVSAIVISEVDGTRKGMAAGVEPGSDFAPPHFTR